MLIGLSGRKGVGKDTIANAVQQANNKVRLLACADRVKRVSGVLFQLSYEQLHDPVEKERVDERYGVSPRVIMQRMGTEFVRNGMIYILFPEMKGHLDSETFWVDATTRDIQSIRKENKEALIIVTDIRFPNEVEMIESLGGCMIRITRGESESVSPEHVSEALQVDESWPVIENNGSVEDAVRRFMDIVMS